MLGEAGFFALGVFVGEEKEGFVFFESATESRAGLNASVGLLGGNQIAGPVDLTGKRVARLERLVAEVAEDVPVEIVGAALGNDVLTTPPVARPYSACVIAEDHLEFLDGFLGNGGADAVDGVVDGVGAVDADHVGASARAADAKAAVGGGADGVRVIPQGFGN